MEYFVICFFVGFPQIVVVVRLRCYVVNSFIGEAIPENEFGIN